VAISLPYERDNSIIVSDIPAVLPQIDRIIQQMDRKTQEVEIDSPSGGRHPQLRAPTSVRNSAWTGQR